MALVLADRVKETTTTTGTGTLTLGGAANGFQSFAVVGNGNTCYYAISANGVNFYEVGIGTYTASGTTLSRDTILASSNSNNAVDLQAGTKDVYVVYPAGRAVVVDGTTIQIPNNAIMPVSAGGTGSNSLTFSGANITSINASNISSGTLNNARTTAASANGASTIVARDATGNFTANNVTATNFIGTLNGSGANVSTINASNITTGQLANDRTTANSTNSASTLVLRDTGGNFSANTVTANLTGTAANATTLQNARNFQISGGATAANVSFNGSGDVNLSVTAMNASVINTGTLSNDRTTASSSNGANTIVQRDGSGDFTARNVSATNFIGTLNGSGANVTSINASNISSGTLSNDRTTASASNGANTIVSRVASGNFTANVITANGSAITAINAANISTGTLANGRTTAASANGASTIVARDASGNFAANTITASLTGTAANATVLQTARNFEISGGATAAAVSFNGSAAVNLSVTGINASVINTGTIANDRTTGSASNGANSLVLRDANGSFSANVVTALNFSGPGGSITSINASNISSGTLDNARTTGSASNGANTLVLRDASGNFTTNNVTANNLSGAGAGITSINASNISTGTLNNARTTAASTNGASTIVARDASGNFAANVITANGSSITAINASNISTGTLNNARTTAASTNGASTIVARDASGNFSANTITANLTGTAANATVLQTARTIALQDGATGTATSFNGSANISIPVTAINASVINTGTLANARTTGSASNGANTLVLRDANGDFTGRNVSATNFIGTLNGSGANVTSINATNISSGTLNADRLPTVPASKGGTGQTTLTAENVIIGNGTSAVKFVAPGTSGNVLSSNGTAWISTAVSGGQFLGTDTPKAIMYNGQFVGANVTVPNTFNALSAGPITVNANVVVTINSGAVWTIV